MPMDHYRAAAIRYSRIPTYKLQRKEVASVGLGNAAPEQSGAATTCLGSVGLFIEAPKDP